MNKKKWIKVFSVLLSGCIMALLVFAGGCLNSSKELAEQKKGNATLGCYKTAKGEIVRDRFWIWAHPAGSFNGEYKLPGTSQITPVEGAHYMGIPNVIFVRYRNGIPAHLIEQYAIPFKSLKQVNWSIVGPKVDKKQASEEETQSVLNLAAKMPNITGVMMDDFFHSGRSKSGEAKAALTVAQLMETREKLNNVAGRRLDLSVVLYTHQISPEIMSHIDLCDVISLWTWKAKDLNDLESNFAKLKQMAPTKRILLGCYMWDFGGCKPMPIELIQKQCELGLKWLKAGQIEGIIFLATPICDLNLEAVEWSRQWIVNLGDEPL